MSQGTVKIKNMNAYYEWLRGLSFHDGERANSRMKEAIKAHHPEKLTTARHSLILAEKRANHLFYLDGGWASYPETETPEYKWPQHIAKRIKEYEQLFSFAESFGQEVLAAEWQEEYAVIYIGNPQAGLFVVEPGKYLEFLPARSYDDISPAELKAQLLPASQADGNAAGVISVDGNMTTTTNQAKNQLAQAEKELQTLEREMEAIRREKTGELAAMKAEIEAMEAKMEARKEELMAVLQQKMDEMEAQKEKLEDQIYLLDSQIFAIRCYAGETVRFAAIRTGKPAPVTEPVVVHQKLRFLDEELGKLASLYTIQWEDLHLFEEFLKHSPIALDTFAPNQRCIVLVRLSRTGKELGRDNSEHGTYQNLLKAYDYYHGRTIGILIRNGENLYLGWTDDNYVKIDDDFVNNVVDVTVDAPTERVFMFESEKKHYREQQRTKKKKAMSDVLSRLFVANILQGIVDHSDLLPLPEGVRFDQDSPYIRYALADTWLDDGRFGDFTEIIERCNASVTAGDMLLTVQKLVPEHERNWGSNSWAGPNRPWDNSRGRGEANRTHDCSVSDCSLYPANLVEYDEPIKMVRYRFKVPSFIIGSDEDEWRYGEMQECFWNEPEENKNKEFVLAFETRKRHVYVSVEKEENWRRCGMPYERQPRSNFELYDDEYINLTYMNSVWLGWVITQKKLGGWRIGGKEVDYAYAIKYLKTAMDFIREREEEEKSLITAIDPTICEDAEWPLKLSEWKLKKGVRVITAYQAKRFVKVVQEGPGV